MRRFINSLIFVHILPINEVKKIKVNVFFEIKKRLKLLSASENLRKNLLFLEIYYVICIYR